MRRWLAKRADFGTNQGRGYQHSHNYRQRARAGAQDCHQPTGIARANPGSSLAHNSSEYAVYSSKYAGSRFGYTDTAAYPTAGSVDSANCGGYIGPLPGQGAIRAS